MKGEGRSVEGYQSCVTGQFPLIPFPKNQNEGKLAMFDGYCRVLSLVLDSFVLGANPRPQFE